MKNLIKLSILYYSIICLISCSNNPPVFQGNTKLKNEIATAINTVFQVQNSLELDELEEILSTDFKRIAADVNTNGIDEYKAFLRRSQAMFSVYDMQIIDIAVNESGGFVRWRFEGIYIGKGSVSSGSDINVSGLTHYEFDGGRITSEFVGFNPGWFQAQLSPDAERPDEP